MRRFLMFHVCISISLLGFILPAHAGQWQENFEEKNLHGWTLLFRNVPKDWESKWETRGGVLDVTLKRIRGLHFVDFLQWTVRPLHAQSLTVTVHSIDAFPVGVRPKWPPGDFGVFLGKKLPQNHQNFATGYFFSKSYVSPSEFSKNGKESKEGPRMASYIRRRQLKIHFRAGHFQLFSEEEILLTEFEDPKLTRIHVVGLLAIPNGVADEFHGEVDLFTISGPGIPNHNLAVQPKGKLATTWGELKNF